MHESPAPVQALSVRTTRGARGPSSAAGPDMPPTIDQFLGQLYDAGVVTPAAVEECLGAAVSETSVEEVARTLVRARVLTRFQAEQAYRGKAAGLVLDTYLLLDAIGAGGMGQVFKAIHRRMDRVVAIKLLSQALSRDTAAVARFEREVRAAARISHPNIVAALDAGQVGSTRFLVMEYVDGRDLSKVVKKQGPLSIPRAIDYTLQAARGLAAAHALGVIHRDVKPANLLVDAAGAVKILDMGLARIHGEGHQSELTATGAVMGTVDYMAPEQALDTKQADARADIYGLGCTLWYLLCGRPVFNADSLVSKLLAHRDAPIPELKAARPNVPELLDTVFRKMVAKRAEDRYQSMDHVITALEHCTRSGLAEETGDPEPEAPFSSSALDVDLEDTVASDGFAFASDPSRGPSRSRRWSPPRWLAVAAGGVLALGAVGTWVIARRPATAPVDPPAAAVTAADAVASAAPPAAAAVPPPSGPPPATGTTETKPFAADRAAVAWALERQATVTILRNGLEESLKPGSPLPPGDWRVVAISRPNKGDWSRETLTVIEGLPELRSLSLFECQLSADAMRVVAGLPSLTTLDLQRSWCNDTKVRALAGKTSLTTLNLRDTVVTDAILTTIGTMPNLKVLDLSNTRLVGQTLDRLSACTELGELSLDLLNLQPGWSEPLSSMESLRHIRLNKSSVTNSDVERLATLRGLTALELGGTLIDDRVVPTLLVFPNMSYLQVDNTALTQDAVEQLRRGLRPTVQLHAGNPVPPVLAALRRGEIPWQPADLTRLGPSAAPRPATPGQTENTGFGQLVDGVLQLDHTVARLAGVEGRDLAVRATLRPFRAPSTPADRIVLAGVILRDNETGGVGFMVDTNGQLHEGLYTWVDMPPFRSFHHGTLPRASLDGDGAVAVTVAVVGRSAYMWAGDQFRSMGELPRVDAGGVVLGIVDGATWIRDVEYAILSEP